MAIFSVETLPWFKKNQYISIFKDSKWIIFKYGFFFLVETVWPKAAFSIEAYAKKKKPTLYFK